MPPRVTMLDSLNPQCVCGNTQAHTDRASLLPAGSLTHQPVPGVNYQQPLCIFLPVP